MTVEILRILKSDVVFVPWNTRVYGSLPTPYRTSLVPGSLVSSPNHHGPTRDTVRGRGINRRLEVSRGKEGRRLSDRDASSFLPDSPESKVKKTVVPFRGQGLVVFVVELCVSPWGGSLKVVGSLLGGPCSDPLILGLGIQIRYDLIMSKKEFL